MSIATMRQLFILTLFLLSCQWNLMSCDDAELVTIVELGQDGSTFSLHYIDPGLYIYGNGLYYGAFLTTNGNGIIMIDAPPSFGDNVIINDIVSLVSNDDIKYVIYSHHHLDHIGGASQFETIEQNTEIQYICHEKAYDKIEESFENGQIPNCDIKINTKDLSKARNKKSSSDSNADSNNSKRRLMRRLSSDDDGDDTDSSSDDSNDGLKKLVNNGVLELGNQYINLDYWGAVHTEGNLWIYSRQHEFLMIVDFVFPGWIPFRFLALASDGNKYINAHDYALNEENNYDISYFVGGHLDRIGNRHDIEINQDFTNDLFEAANIALSEISFNDVSGTDTWDFFKNYQNAVAQRCVEILNNDYSDSEWYTTWNGINTFIEDHCWIAQESISINH